MVSSLFLTLSELFKLSHLDPFTLTISFVIIPIIVVFGIAIKRFARQLGGYIVGAAVFTLSKFLFGGLSATFTLSRYAKLALAGTSSSIHIPSSTSDVSLRLDDIFVPLSLEKALDQRIYDHSSLFEVGSRIRIIGDPGSGKSTIAKRLFRDECRKGTGVKTSKFPIFVELKTIAIPQSTPHRNLGTWLLSHIKKIATSYNVYDMEKCFAAYIGSKGLLIILDGLDEVSTTLYPRVRDAINSFSQILHQQSENNTIIITLRTQFHQQIRGDYLAEFPQVLMLRRFSSTDIYRFLSNWPFPVSQKSDDVLRIYTDLSDKPALREMCTNPLILSMYVARDQQAANLGMTPATRTSFYGSVAEELVIRRRLAQIRSLDNQDVIRNQRYRVLGAIAFNHLVLGLDSPNYISWKEAIAAVVKETKKSPAKSEELLQEISKDTGLITEERPGEILRFIHLTFCEYFAAYYAREYLNNGWHAVLTSYLNSQNTASLATRLVEVVPFAIALIPKSSQDAALADISDYTAFYMIALCYMETKLYGSRWENFRNRFELHLLTTAHKTFEKSVSADWFRDIHIYLVLVNDAQRALQVLQELDQPHYDVASFFTQIASESALQVSALTMAYASQDANAAFRVASECGIDVPNQLPEMIVRNADQPAFLDMILQMAGQDAKSAPRLLTLVAEAALDSEAVAAALYKRAPIGLVPSPNSSRWCRSKLIANTLLGECLDLACRSIGEERKGIPLVLNFSELPVLYSNDSGRVIFVLSKYFGIIYATVLFSAMILVEIVALSKVFRVISIDREPDRLISTMEKWNDWILTEAIQDRYIWLSMALLFMLFYYVLSFHIRYLLPRYYRSLNLYNQLRVAKFVRLPRFFSYLIAFNPARAWPFYGGAYEKPSVVFLPLTRLCALERFDNFIRYRAGERDQDVE